MDNNFYIYMSFVVFFPFFLIASIISYKKCDDNRMCYISAALLCMASSSGVVGIFGDYNPFARSTSLFIYGFSGVLLFKGATNKSWKTVDMMLLTVFVFMSSMIGAFMTFTPHSIVMPSAFIVFAGLLVMGIRYSIVDDLHIVATSIILLAIISLISGGLIGTKELSLFLILKMTFIIFTEISLIVCTIISIRDSKRGRHVR